MQSSYLSVDLKLQCRGPEGWTASYTAMYIYGVVMMLVFPIGTVPLLAGVVMILIIHPLRAGIPSFYAVSLYTARFELCPHLKIAGNDNWRELFIRQPFWTEGDPCIVGDKESHPLDFLVSACK